MLGDVTPTVFCLLVCLFLFLVFLSFIFLIIIILLREIRLRDTASSEGAQKIRKPEACEKSKFMRYTSHYQTFVFETPRW